MLILTGTPLQPIGSHCLYKIQSSLSVSKNYLLSQPWNLALLTAENYSGVNPLSPKSDQNQISPCNINASQNKLVLRITDMITQDEFA